MAVGLRSKMSFGYPQLITPIMKSVDPQLLTPIMTMTISHGIYWHERTLYSMVYYIVHTVPRVHG